MFVLAHRLCQELIMTATAVLPELSSTVHYNTIRIGDVDVFYREAGTKTAPVVLLLHGFLTSSNMFRNLIPRLAGSFRLIAPDYPGTDSAACQTGKISPTPLKI
jgi:hypothetical protein